MALKTSMTGKPVIVNPEPDEIEKRHRARLARLRQAIPECREAGVDEKLVKELELELESRVKALQLAGKEV